MLRGRDKSTAFFPTAAFAVALCFTIAVFVGLGVHTWNSFVDTRALHDRDLRILKLCGDVTYLDEVLTMSSRMAATTGDPRWERRYRRFEPQLEDAIEELLHLAPELKDREGAAQTELANEKLVGMERTALALIAKGARDQAEALLFSEEYERQKEIHAEGMRKALAALRARTMEALEVQRNRTAWAVAAVIGALAIMVPAWLAAFTVMRRHITERKRVEEELRNSAERLQAIIASEPECVKIVARDGTVLEMNPAGLSMVEARSRDEVIGKPVFDLIHPEDRPRFQAFCDSVADDGPGTLEFRIVGLRGGIRQMETHSVPLRDDSGNVTSLLSVTRDVTDRKRAEEALRKAHAELELRVQRRTAELRAANTSLEREITERKRAEEALRESSATLAKMVEEQNALLQHTRDFVYRHDAKGVFNYLSPAVEQVTGYSVREWWTHYTAYLTDNPINEKVIANTEETLRTGKESPPYLVEIAHKDGHPVMLEVSERPYFEGGKVAGIVGVARDVTERVRAEAALRESEQRLEAILDNTTAVIYMKDVKGRYILINRRYEELFHIPRKRIVGKTDYDLFPEEMAEAFRDNDLQVLKAGAPIEFEEVAPHDDGPHTYISLKFPLFDSAGLPYAVCGISTDITDRKRAAEELEKAKEAAEAASRAKSVFLANISHEIRTPLTAMLGAAELLAAREDGGKHAPRLSDMIIRNGRHLLALINDLLDLSRAEAGKLEVECLPAALPEIIADVRAVTEPLHRRPEVDFRFRYETPIPSSIHTDPTRLKEALINLISNALKFTYSGHVWVRIKVQRDRPEPRLSIAVEDTGTGIPAGDTERIFEAFTQLVPRSSGVTEGVGLGLPLAKCIAERLGGTVEVKTSEQSGSTFTLRVATGPLDDVTWVKADEISVPPRSPTGIPARQGGGRLQGNVLLADDFPDTRNLVKEVLTGKGAVVTCVDNGEAAVEAALTQSFDLILMDIRMPRMDGITAAAELRRRGCLTPIIALTASTTQSNQRHILDAGFDDLWAKPMTLDNLLHKTAGYLRTIPDEPNATDQGEAGRPVLTADNPRLEAVRAEFIRNLPQRLGDVAAAVEARDMSRAREVLHQLVGAGGIHGLMPISDEAARLLALAKSGSLTDRPDELQTLKDLVQHSVRSLAEPAATTPLPPSHQS